jgi:ABC-2 type transport system ATP-binding protein
MAVVEAQDLHRTYRTHTGTIRRRAKEIEAVKGVSFEIQQGELFGLLGPNGAGKTTIIEILEGFRGRSAGEVTVLGVDPERAGEDWRAQVGIVLQSWRDHAKWRVRELLADLAAYYRPYSTTERPRPRDVDGLIRLVGLDEQAAQRIGTLSGGQRRRLDVAIGLIGQPELLFLDEPTAGFDPEARRDFHELIRGLADEATTIFLTTHDLDEAEKLADRIIILARGRIVADGSADELARRMSGEAEVRWRRGDERFRETTADATGFVRRLLAEDGEEVADLEVRRATLEDTYLAMVRRDESGAGDGADEGAGRA